MQNTQTQAYLAPSLWTLKLFKLLISFLPFNEGNVTVLVCCCSVAQSCLTLRAEGLQQARLPCPSLSPGVCLTHVHWVGDAIQPSHPLLSPSPSIFPSSRVFSYELAFHISWPKYSRFSFSISPSNEYSGLISFRMDWFDLLAVQDDSQEFSATPQFKSINSSEVNLLYGPTLIHTQLLENPQFQLYRPRAATWCLCFSICCLGLS